MACHLALMVTSSCEISLLTVHLTVYLLLVQKLATPIKIPSYLTLKLRWHTMQQYGQLSCDDIWAKALTMFNELINEDGGMRDDPR